MKCYYLNVHFQGQRINAHVRYVAGEVALEQVSPEISSVSPSNQHSTTAPNVCPQICDMPKQAAHYHIIGL